MDADDQPQDGQRISQHTLDELPLTGDPQDHEQGKNIRQKNAPTSLLVRQLHQ
jgi:hypothetical protein